jgi:hypothetical protein
LSGVDVDDSPLAERSVQPNTHRAVGVFALTNYWVRLAVNADKHPNVDLVLALIHHDLADAAIVPA